MQTNLINSYVHTKNALPQNKMQNSGEDIEVVTIRKAKPNFDINRELANRTFIRPLPPKGHIVKDGIMSAPAVFVQDMAYDMKALKAAWKGDANDHQLGKLNDLGMKLGGLALASYLFTIKKAPVAKGMEFVGVASFFASMALWPKLALELPARLIHGFNPFMSYEDSQGRKKPFFQDNQYLPFDLISDKEINRIGNRMGIPKDMPNRREAVQEKMRQVALQNNTMWMLTAGFATPLMSSLICNRLEPYVRDVHSYFMNKKVDDILVDFASAQKKYYPQNIVKDVDSVIEMYKGGTIDKNVIESLTAALTQDLNPKVAIGVQADLERMFLGDKYNISKLQIKPMINVITKNVKKTVGDNVLSQHVSSIVPSEEQMVHLFDVNKYDGKQLSIREMKGITDSIASIVEANIQQLKNGGVNVNKNLAKKIVKSLVGTTQESGPLIKILSGSSANVFDDSTQNVIRNIASRMASFCAENNALSMYSFKKLASAPDTAKGKFWNDVANSLIDILKITPEEIELTRHDRPLVAKLLQQKMQQIAADKNAYNDVMKAAAAKLSEIERYVKPDDMTGKYITQLESSFNDAAQAFRDMGLNKTAERLIGINGNEAGSLIKVSKAFVNDNLTSVKNSFARFFNTMNFYRTIVNDPNLNIMNARYDIAGNVIGSIEPTAVAKEVKEEIVALSEFLATSGRISDYSVKFEFLRNLTPEVSDFGGITLNNDNTIKYRYYNPKKLAAEGVFLPNDTDFFKRVMNLLYGGAVQPETAAALTEYSPVKTMLAEFRTNMMNQVGDLGNFAYPSKVVHDLWDENGRVYSKATPAQKSLCVGNALDELISNCGRQSYNTRKWLKMFGKFGAGLLGVTVLSQFFFGRRGNKVDKK